MARRIAGISRRGGGQRTLSANELEHALVVWIWDLAGAGVSGLDGGLVLAAAEFRGGTELPLLRRHLRGAGGGGGAVCGAARVASSAASGSAGGGTASALSVQHAEFDLHA